MKRLKILKEVLKRTHADRIILGFVIFFLLDALVILLVEPGITTYWDAIWYCYSVFSTVGFGDLTSVSIIGRILSIILTIYTILVVALVTGVIVAFYNDIVAMKYKASKAELLDKLEHLEDLSKEELAEISERIRKIS
ncbi:MAG: two pore domain potassium channel family protein [Parasporobacterium sp.]|nr:two pore domain potassium channel family protein [Parasporobacterium sp.]